jgi:hypothetical protein
MNLTKVNPTWTQISMFMSSKEYDIVSTRKSRRIINFNRSKLYADTLNKTANLFKYSKICSKRW